MRQLVLNLNATAFLTKLTSSNLFTVPSTSQNYSNKQREKLVIRIIAESYCSKL